MMPDEVFRLPIWWDFARLVLAMIALWRADDSERFMSSFIDFIHDLALDPGEAIVKHPRWRAGGKVMIAAIAAISFSGGRVWTTAGGLLFLAMFIWMSHVHIRALQRRLDAAEHDKPPSLSLIASIRKLRNHASLLRDNYQHLDPFLAIPHPTVERWYQNRDEALRIISCVEELLGDRPELIAAFEELAVSLRTLVDAELSKENSFQLQKATEDMVDCFDVVIEAMAV